MRRQPTPTPWCALLLCLAPGGLHSKKVGLHEHASDQFKEKMHNQVLQSRVQVIEAMEVDTSEAIVPYLAEGEESEGSVRGGGSSVTRSSHGCRDSFWEP